MNPEFVKVVAKFPTDAPENAEIIEALLGEFPFNTFETEGSSLHAYGTFSDFESIDKKEIAEVLKPYIISTLEWSFIEKRNWNEEWEKSVSPIWIKPQVYIRAPFHPEPEQEPDYEIVIEPRMSFGTGHHETTRLMIEIMLHFKFIWKNSRCLDMGCGTGILGIMAEKLGASSVVGVDVETWAAENTLENAELNNCERVTSIHGDASSLNVYPEYCFDHILANIQKNILLQDAQAYQRVLRKGGTLSVSGFFPEDLKDIETHFSTLNFRKQHSLIGEKWCSATFLYV